VFKKELGEVYQKIPPALVADIGSRLEVCPPWIMTVYSECFLPSSAASDAVNTKADEVGLSGAEAAASTETQAAAAAAAAAASERSSLRGKRFPLHASESQSRSRRCRWRWKKIPPLAPEISAEVSRQCHTFYLRDSYPGELELSSDSASTLLELVVKMGETMSVLSSAGASTVTDIMQSAEIVLQQKIAQEKKKSSSSMRKGEFGSCAGGCSSGSSEGGSGSGEVEDEEKPFVEKGDISKRHRLVVMSEAGCIAVFPTSSSDPNIDTASTSSVVQPAHTSFRKLGIYLRFLSQEGLY